MYLLCPKCSKEKDSRQDAAFFIKKKQKNKRWQRLTEFLLGIKISMVKEEILWNLKELAKILFNAV